ncbi:MAG TPA: hypothetical protein H9875_08525 [Candidatus Levilactobacillus faecigallinarum]|uniref:Uncharacterized protein n=1 Tax=Candidatus Levilactobacillus faecigallinarum TaxID=2838638 RepID=A0A9D1QTT2_9LACO|nr:hypothetical protein [Candidatus Levilactobacillus faecigallinarum]
MIKRGTKIVWHRSSFDSKAMRLHREGKLMLSDGNTKEHKVHHGRVDVTGTCFGVVPRPAGKMVLAIFEGSTGHMSEVPLEQVTEAGE